MEAIPGETIPRKILRDEKFSTAREKLPFEIGKSLAKIHQTQLEDLKALDHDQELLNLLIVFDGFWPKIYRFQKEVFLEQLKIFHL